MAGGQRFCARCPFTAGGQRREKQNMHEGYSHLDLCTVDVCSDCYVNWPSLFKLHQLLASKS